MSHDLVLPSDLRRDGAAEATGERRRALHTGRATQVVTSGASGDIARVTKKGV